MANYQLKKLQKIHEREVKIKTAKWESLTHTGKMTKEAYDQAILMKEV